jgi:hypothetical protein
MELITLAIIYCLGLYTPEIRHFVDENQKVAQHAYAPIVIPATMTPGADHAK